MTLLEDDTPEDFEEITADNIADNNIINDIIDAERINDEDLFDDGEELKELDF